MPILIRLKEPAINLIIDEEIKDDAESVREWDTLFNNGVFITKSLKGNKILVPLWKECNVAFMQNVSLEEIEAQKKAAEEAAKHGPGGGAIIDTPAFLFPGRKQKP